MAIRSKLAVFVLVGVAVAGLAACGDSGGSGDSGDAATSAPAGWTNLSPAELSGMLEHKDFTLVNVHVPYEGELPQTDAFVAYDRIGDELDRLPADRAAKIVLYCRSGRMSTTAAQTLVDAGYTDVSQLAGGFTAWEQAGYQLLQDPAHAG